MEVFREMIGKTAELSMTKKAISGNARFVNATVKIGDYLFIKIVIRRSKAGKWFVSYPSYIDTNGEYVDLVFAKNEFTKAILEAFSKICKKANKASDLDTIDINDCEDLGF